MHMSALELTLFADYFQFYLQDESAQESLADSWTDEATSRLLAVASGSIGVGTVRNMDVPVSVEVLEVEPALDAERWDHITQCSIDVPSGKLVIAGCTDYFPEAKRIRVSPGTYVARVSYGALTTLSEDRLDGADHYRVQLWPGRSAMPIVIKQRVAQ
jgi:hypothetical protein